MDVPATAHGVAKPVTPEERAKDEVGYTNPNLHRRIDLDMSRVPIGSDYPFIHYREDGTPYPQDVTLGVWDGYNSYRTTTTFTHDEESTTCEIP